MEKVIDCLTVNYANFSGRASRSEYWYFVLFTVVVSIILKVLGAVSSLKTAASTLYIIFQLGIFIPSLAVLARRLHDKNKSGWLQLIAIIPFAGLYILYLCCTRGTIGVNDFGVDPIEG
ncbi:MAG: DUF805 domain-containing protein [bacterium]